MKIWLITLFPEFFASPLVTGLLGRAVRQEKLQVSYIDPRNFTFDRHRTVDDSPYGGGAGMVLKPEPVVRAIEAARGEGAKVVLLSPQGRLLKQAELQNLTQQPKLAFVCGRYEGFDERIRSFVDDEISAGDYVLTGGEYAALSIVDGIARLLPGVLGNEASSCADSFSDGLLEYPQYTRPAEFRGMEVPAILLEGHHERVETWRRSMQLSRTAERRPDLLPQAASPVPTKRAVQRAKLVVKTHDRLRFQRVASSFGVEVQFVDDWSELDEEDVPKVVRLAEEGEAPSEAFGTCESFVLVVGPDASRFPRSLPNPSGYGPLAATVLALDRLMSPAPAQ